MLLDTLKNDLIKAMKTADSVRIATLRFLLAGIRNAAISKYGSRGEAGLTDEDILAVIKRQTKERRESIEAFTKGGRQDLVEKEQAQLNVLETYLPKELSDEELKAILAPIAASGETNFGLLMKQAMAAIAGRADGRRVSSLIKKLLVQI